MAVPSMEATLGPSDRDPVLLLSREGFRDRWHHSEQTQLLETHSAVAAKINELFDIYGIEPASTYGVTLTMPVDYFDADKKTSSIFLFRDENVGKINLIALTMSMRGEKTATELFELGTQEIAANAGNDIICGRYGHMLNQEEVNWLRILVTKMGDAYKKAATETVVAETNS